MNPLHTFYNNEGERESFKQYLIQALERIAVKRAFEGVDNVGIKEARELIEEAFDKLGEEYGKLEKPKVMNSR